MRSANAFIAGRVSVIAGREAKIRVRSISQGPRGASPLSQFVAASGQIVRPPAAALTLRAAG